MVISVTISLKEVIREGKNFKWKCPEGCPKCLGKLWGHGFVVRYFNNISELVWIKRYRCQGCGIVISFRPEEYWTRARSSILDIYQSLRKRLMDRRWPEGVSRQRALHWLHKFLQF